MVAGLSRLVALPTLVFVLSLCCSAAAQNGPGPSPLTGEPAEHDASPAADDPLEAEPAGEADLDRARLLFAEGLKFVAQQDWVNAADRFEQVRAIRSSPVVSYNLASALAELGQLVESSTLLTQILSDAQADAETRRVALLLLTKLEPQIGSIAISVYGNSADCRFALDGEPIEITGVVLSVRVGVGEHAITVERDGAVILSPRVTIGGSFPMQAQLSLEIPPRPRPRPAQVTLPPPPRKTFELQLPEPGEPARDDDGSVFEQWWLWAGAGAVVAGAVVATLVLTSSDEPKPVAGDTMPPVIHTRVVMGTLP